MKFARISIPSSQIFYQSSLSFCFVNISPVVPGHVLIAPARCVLRMSQMTKDEAADLMLVSQLIGRVCERAFGGTSLTFVCQDGREAGQTVPHVHMHILPRRPDDFQRNDDVYDELEGKKRVWKDDDPNRVLRSPEVMEKEATFLRQCIVEQQVLDAANSLLNAHFEAHNVDAGHGIDHANVVLRNCSRAVWAAKDELDEFQRITVMLASLLHDADDRKFFGSSSSSSSSSSMPHARRIATEALSKGPEKWGGRSRDNVADSVIECIELVSASKNKNSTVEASRQWMLIPRFSDRLEAIGWPGIARCYVYNRHIGAPLYTDKTPRVTNEEELERVAPRSRFASYDGNSESMISHFYDKLIHVCELETTNPFFVSESKLRRKILVDFLFHFGRTGTLDEDQLKNYI